MHLLFSILFVLGASFLNLVNASPQLKTCIVKGGGSNATDDSPEILHAFKKCGKHGKVIFEPRDYYVNSVMNVFWLEDVDIDIHGRLVVCL